MKKSNILIGPVAAFSVMGLIGCSILLAAWLHIKHKDITTPPMQTAELIEALERCDRLDSTVEVYTDHLHRPQWVVCYWSSKGKEPSDD